MSVEDSKTNVMICCTRTGKVKS